MIWSSSGGDFRPQARGRLVVFVDDRIDHSLVAGTLKRRSARQHFVKQHAQRPDVGAVVDIRVFGLLRRHVGNGSHGRVGLGDS